MLKKDLFLIFLIFIFSFIISYSIHHTILYLFKLNSSINLIILTYLLISIIINEIIYYYFKSEIYYWLRIILFVFFFSMLIGSLFQTLGDENAGSYAIAIGSILGIVITLNFNQKNIIAQMKKSEENVIIQSRYDFINEALIKTYDFINEKIEESNLNDDTWIFINIFHSLINESFFIDLPLSIRKKIYNFSIEIEKKFPLELIFYFVDIDNEIASFERYRKTSLKSVKSIKSEFKEKIKIKHQKHINFTIFNYGILYFIDSIESNELNLNVKNNKSEYKKFRELIYNPELVKQKDYLILEKKLDDFKKRNQNLVYDEIKSPVMGMIEELREDISLDTRKKLILNDIKENL